MPQILDQLSAESGRFRPETAREFFALQLARKLNDVANARMYAALADSVPEDTLLNALVQREHSKDTTAAQAFQLNLRRLTRQTPI